MEEAYMDDINESIENDIFTSWLYSYDDEDFDEYKIFDLAKKFKVSTKKVIAIVKDELNNSYLKSLSVKELNGLYGTLKIHQESAGNRLQMEIIKSILDDRSNGRN